METGNDMESGEYVELMDVDYPQGQVILCCLCGVAIQPNPSNTCMQCLQSQITADLIPTQTVLFCKQCDRYHQHPSTWTVALWESKELLSICLKKLNMKLLDGQFIYTEPHSKRIKTKVTYEKDLGNNTIVHHTQLVEYIVAYTQCPECTKLAAQQTWSANVQLRQHSKQGRSLLFLEQLILKNRMHLDCVGIKPVSQGMDMHFVAKHHAQKFVEFVLKVVPARMQMSDQIISVDLKSNTANVKITFSVEIVPLSRLDLLCLPKQLANKLSGISQICIVHRVGKWLHLIDPVTLRTAELSAERYWSTHPTVQGATQGHHKNTLKAKGGSFSGAASKAAFGSGGFPPLSTVKELVQFYVIDIEEHHIQSNQFQLSTVCVGRMSDNQMFSVKSHLGHILHPGDTVECYDLTNQNFNNDDFGLLKNEKIPDVIIIRKMYPKKQKKRGWNLKRLNTVDQNEDTYNAFLQDVEEDQEVANQIEAWEGDKIVNLQDLMQGMTM